MIYSLKFFEDIRYTIYDYGSGRYKLFKTLVTSRYAHRTNLRASTFVQNKDTAFRAEISVKN
jgi:hypothetical protein